MNLKNKTNIKDVMPYFTVINSGKNSSYYGIKIHTVISGNDGDVPLACITHELLQGNEPKYCIDIGVDKGWWSFFAADCNPNVHVDSFEPNPDSYNAIQVPECLKNQIVLHDVAISNKTGTLPFIFNEGQSHSRTESSTFVKCETLDTYIQNKSVDLIKIDTEGHDLIILESLHPYLDQIKAIVFECTVYWNGTTMSECIETTLNELTYLKSKYTYMYILPRRVPDSVDFINYIFLIELKTEDDITEKVIEYYNMNIQIDILVCNTPIQTLSIK